MSTLTPEAKSKLASTIRRFRGTKDNPNGGLLLKGLRDRAESEYRLSIASIAQAELPEAQRERRLRLEMWLKEQARADLAGKTVKDRAKAISESKARHLTEAIKLAGATLLNRLVVIMQLEAQGMSRPAVVTGGWDSPGYREFRDEFGPALCKDESVGYGFLLKLLYDELALELPGLFGSVGLVELFPVPVSTLRAVVEALNNPALESAWTDDTTLGWVYQYWNDPEREALDTKLDNNGKLENHEIASKTQMFTERYMVEWLLQNSLGQQWLAICKKNEWTPEVVSNGTLDALDVRRADWREKRESGEVTLDALMPIESEQEEHWKYWVKQPELGSEGVPKSIREIKIFDPACGSGHFLVIAFDLLFAFYEEESRQGGEDWDVKNIVESILENNLFGLDLDPRAVQITAAALYLKAKALCEDASPRVLNLVASDLNLAAFQVDDPAREELRMAVQAETGIPGALTDKIIEALKGADTWGSLLQVDKAVEEAIREYENVWQSTTQRSLLENEREIDSSSLSPEKKNQEIRIILLEKLETFLTSRTRSDDLGLRLKGEQLASGVRFIRMVRSLTYDLVIGNPPYQGTSKMEEFSYVERYYKESKDNLYAAFLQRGMQLSREQGLTALLTMRDWMFIKQYSKLRKSLLSNFSLNAIGDLDQAAFEFVVDSEVLTVAMFIFEKTPPSDKSSIAIRWTQMEERGYDTRRTQRKVAAFLSQAKRFEFVAARFDSIQEKPLIYWWDDLFLKQYSEAPKIGEAAPVRAGMQTSNNVRFIRVPWEVLSESIDIRYFSDEPYEVQGFTWVAYIKGAAKKSWFEPLDSIMLWKHSALEKQVVYDYLGSDGGGNGTPSRQFYFLPGVAYSKIGASFRARKHRFRSVIGDAGASAFPENTENFVCLMNSQTSKGIIACLNPTANFTTGDVKRLPVFPIESADEIFAQLDTAFTTHESAREPSVEFIHPAPTCWPYAQAWAQRAVDRPAGEPLPPWEPEYEDPKATDWISYAVGLALGRFPLKSTTETSSQSESQSQESGGRTAVTPLPNGILYLSNYSTGQPNSPDSLTHPACAPLHDAWATHSSAITKKDLHTWLREKFFPDVHLKMYEQRPIYFPLTSAHKNFVAYLSIHRWQNNTLKDLLAHYLTKDLTALQGELADLETDKTSAITQGNTKSQTAAANRQDHIRTLHTELTDFITLVRQCAEVGPLPAEANDPQPEGAASYQMNLDDGVMINSAALWPLLAPQWSTPKKNCPKAWWSQLCIASPKGNKDYDWSHLAARYFPTRVDEKCQKDPSLAVAHGCFWQYHPAKAYEWELRLQDEIAPDFTIDEVNSDALRQQFEDKHPDKVKELKLKEEKRRERKYKKQLALEVQS